MILSKIVKIRMTHRYIAYYIKKGYICEVNDIIDVKVSDLKSGSHQRVDVKCDFCDRETDTDFRRANKEKYCCNKCNGSTVESTNKKYGVDNVFQIEEVKEKIKETNLERYGVSHPLKSEIIKDKLKATNQERYGVDNVFQIEEVKEKIKETNLKIYGTDYANQNEDVKQKILETNLERYGAKQIYMSEPYRLETYNISKNKNYIKYLNKNISLFHCKKCNNNYKIDSSLYSMRVNYDVETCTNCNPINSHVSGKELKLLEFIKENYDGEIITSDRKILNGKEIDILLPELNLGFEFNGDYWHSSDKKETGYHFSKSRRALENGIRLYHIWENVWENKNSRIKEIILTYIKRGQNL